MSIRKDMPSMSHIVPPRIFASSNMPDGPRAVLAAVETVGAQMREHRAEIDTQLGEMRASLQHTQQALAKFDGQASGAGMGGAVKSVSAQALENSETALEDLRTGVQKTMRASVPSFFPQAATITSGDLEIPSERDSEVYGPLRRAFSVRDLLVVRRTSAPSIEYLRATRTGAAAIQVNEGDEKAELAMGFDLVQAPVKTIAAWVPASRQALDDASMLADYIDTELRDALRLTEDAQLLKGTGTGGSILGLMSVAAAYNRQTTGDRASDTLRRAITQVQLARGVVSGAVISPQALERLELLKDTTGRYLFSYNVTDANGRTAVWRMPVVVTDAIGAEEFLVGDFTRAARLYDRMQATVEVATQHKDFFTRNLLAILAEERVALTIPRPDLLVTGEFPEADAPTP